MLMFVAIICFANLGLAFAQPSPSRFEVGGQISTLRLSDFAATNIGLGGRLTHDASRRVAIEAEFSFFPHDDGTIDSSAGTLPGFGIEYRRRRSEAFFGPKVGIRGHRVGVFARGRPGFTRVTHRGVGCVGEVCALVLLAVPVYRTEFALDAGGVLEFYPSPRTVARVDIGSTLVRHRSSAPPCWGRSCTSHNFTSRVGIGVRF
jgi:hypothetical protein